MGRLSWVGSEHIHDDGWNNLEVIWIVLKDLSFVNFEEQSVDLVYQVPKARPITARYNGSDPLNEGCQRAQFRRMMGPAPQPKEGGRNSSNHSAHLPFEGDL